MKHKHHIIPKHAGGTDDPSNLVELTVEEHAEAHRKLYEEYGRWQDKVAWLALSGRIGKEEIIRMKSSLAHKNKPLSEEHKTKLSISNKNSERSAKHLEDLHKSFIGKKHTKERVDNISKSLTGKKHSKERRLTNSLAQTGKKYTEERKNKTPFLKKIECPYCGIISNLANASRWHFDKCKNYQK
jgi:hypothetical protein